MPAPPFLDRPFSVVDVETTGASAIYDRVIEVAVVRVEGGRIVEVWEAADNAALFT